MRFTVLILAVLALGGCGTVIENPRTGERERCWVDLVASPWSQDEACVANHVAQGWAIANNGGVDHYAIEPPPTASR